MRLQFAVATLLRDTDDGFAGPDNPKAGPLVLQSLVPAGFLQRMNRGKWQRSIARLTESDLCPALVAGFELGEVQLRLVLPLLGAELRDALLSLPVGEPLRLCMTADEHSAQTNLSVNLGPGLGEAHPELADELMALVVVGGAHGWRFQA